MSAGWRRALRWTTALALVVAAGFYWFHSFSLTGGRSYDVLYDAAGWTMIAAVIATPLTSRLPRTARWAGVGLWLAVVVSFTISGILAEYVTGSVGAAISFWVTNVGELPVPLPALIVIAFAFGAAVSGPPARSATVDAIFFWPSEPLDRQSGDSGARL